MKTNPAWSIDMLAALGRTYIRLNDYTRAIEAYGKLIEKAPKLWMAANDLALLLSEYVKTKGDLDRALTLPQETQKLRPDNPAVLDTLGWVYYKKGDAGKAFDFVGKALIKVPESPVINYHMGMALHKLGRLQEAKTRLKKSVDAKEDFTGKDEAKKTLEKM